ncbi:MAG: BON domain-containing protein [Alphaproteobacteria bacterium]
MRIRSVSPFDRRQIMTLALGGTAILAGCSPVSVVQRAIEDRSVEDIAEDNRIVVQVNRLMAKYETISVSTEIYEQRLLVYGIMEDATSFQGFEAETRNIAGVRNLYFHVQNLTPAQQAARDDEIIGFAQGLRIKAGIEAAWLDAPGVESLNFRVGVDPFATAYVLGRAATAAEQDRAVAVVRNTERVRRVVNYSVVG